MDHRSPQTFAHRLVQRICSFRLVQFSTSGSKLANGPILVSKSCHSVDYELCTYRKESMEQIYWSCTLSLPSNDASQSHCALLLFRRSLIATVVKRLNKCLTATYTADVRSRWFTLNMDGITGGSRGRIKQLPARLAFARRHLIKQTGHDHC